MATLLLAEDNTELREMLVMVLEQAGHDVTAAENGKQALKLMPTKPFDLLVTDIVMPDQDGLEMVMQLRKTRPDLPVIAMSGDDPRYASLYLSMASKLGAIRTLHKPFEIGKLLAAIDEIEAARGD